jgi:REP element-mobilizing transposase RayT
LDNSDRVLRSMPKPLADLTISKADEVNVEVCHRNEVPQAPVTLVSAEGLVSLRNMIIEQDAGALDETNKRNLQRHLHKLAKAAQLSLAKGVLQQNHIRFLLTVNNEAKVRREARPEAHKRCARGRRNGAKHQDDPDNRGASARASNNASDNVGRYSCNGIEDAPAPWRAPVARMC